MRHHQRYGASPLQTCAGRERAGGWRRAKTVGGSRRAGTGISNGVVEVVQDSLRKGVLGVHLFNAAQKAPGACGEPSHGGGGVGRLKLSAEGLVERRRV